MSQSLGSRLKYSREQSNLKKADVMQQLKINNLGRYEEDERKPGVDILASLAKLYDVSIDWLVNGSEYLNMTEPRINEHIVANAVLDDKEIVPLCQLEYEMLREFRELEPRDQIDIMASIHMKHERTFNHRTTMSSNSRSGSGKKAECETA